ncbi:MAG: hypothetical protein AAF289_01390 [Cyanobacteria bacterium P01_A01_bin.135]
MAQSTRPPHPRWWKLTLALSAVLLTLGSLYASDHGLFHYSGNTEKFLVGIGVMGAGYAVSWRLLGSRLPVLWFWVMALVPRLIFLPMYPGSDIWRYLWEGYVQLEGFSPYDFAPDAATLEPFRTSWWVLINHPDVSAIYPPLTQLAFRSLAFLTQPQQPPVEPALLVFKLAFVAADLGICALLWRRFRARAILYAWNPLIIYSFSGGGHYDSWLMLPLVVAWLFDCDEVAEGSCWRLAPLLQALLVGISVGVKWVSLPVIGFLAWRQVKSARGLWPRWGMAIAVGVIGLLPMGLSALAYCDATSCPLVPVESEFVMVERSADLLPHLAQQVWPASALSNSWIALPLGAVTLVLLLRCRTLGQFILSYLVALMVWTPIIRAWYFTWMVPFAVGVGLGRRKEPVQWGPVLGSLSVFAYYNYIIKLTAGDLDWNISPWVRSLLWAPFVAGCLWTLYRQRHTPSHS